MSKFAKILETKDIFALNLDDFSGLDDFEISKGLIWNFKYYLVHNTININELFKISENQVNVLIDVDNNTEFTRIIDIISKSIK